MAQTPSNMIPLGTEAPSFSLLDTVSGKTKTLDELKSDQATLIMFICNHCPFVVHVRQELVKLANEYMGRGVSVIAISANDVENYPEDSPQKMTEYAHEYRYPFPYLYDESQNVAKAYDAACTPDFYLFDSSLKLVYRGQLDSSRPGNNIPVTGKDLRAALDAVLTGKKIADNQHPSIGCNIKWKG